MNAKILPLKGKYWGTEIVYGPGDARTIKIWYSDDPVPSDRQLKNWEMTLEEAKEDMMMSDSHYESQTTYRVSMAIVEALQGVPFPDGHVEAA